MKRITFEVDDNLHWQIKERANINKTTLRDYCSNTIINSIKNNASIDFKALKIKIENDKNELIRKMRIEIDNCTVNNFSELFNIQGQLDLINLIINLMEVYK